MALYVTFANWWAVATRSPVRCSASLRAIRCTKPSVPRRMDADTSAIGSGVAAQEPAQLGNGRLILPNVGDDVPRGCLTRVDRDVAGQEVAAGTTGNERFGGA